jgi:adenylate kinase
MSKKYRAILLMGPPGAGKGTVSSFLNLAGAQVHLSTGEIFRHLSPETPQGKQIHSLLKAGALIPDEWVMEIWQQHVEGMIATSRFNPEEQDLLLDGIPRTVRQAQLLEESVELRHIIVLEAADPKELWRRIARRSTQQGRSDDQEEAWKERYSLYQKETQAVLNHFPSSKISRFNALQKPLEVMRDILSKLTPLLCEGTSPFPKN